EAAWLGQPADLEFAIDNVLAAVAGVGADVPLLDVERPDLMMPGHGDEELVVLEPQVPRAVEAGLEAGAAEVPRAVLLARARDRLHRVRLQVERANHVILAIGDIKGLVAQRHALRIIEARLVERAVGLADFARPGDGDLLAGEVGDDNAMMRAVGDEEPIALR